MKGRERGTLQVVEPTVQYTWYERGRLQVGEAHSTLYEMGRDRGTLQVVEPTLPGMRGVETGELCRR